MLTVFVFVLNVFSLPGVILICCSEFYFAVTVVGHRRYDCARTILKTASYSTTDEQSNQNPAF